MSAIRSHLSHRQASGSTNQPGGHSAKNVPPGRRSHYPPEQPGDTHHGQPPPLPPLRVAGSQPPVPQAFPSRGGALPVTLLDILARLGWATLTRFVLLTLLFLLVHTARWPFVGVLWLLTALLRLIDQSVTTRLAGSLSPTTNRWRAAA